ncbi:DUF2190 family protein [Desulfocurvibacter africanus]|uniref:DUF2190 family protein n=1 Tax=Desulfocurvibacter africanus TaxID=873 RepID=UPI000417B2B6|nr:DUF2190 family protein [Desulfocurvibacter africanus]
MATNHVQEGKVINWVNGTGAAIASGAVVVLGRIIGIALAAIANGLSGSVALGEVWTLPAINTAAFVLGADLYWDVATGKLTDVPGPVYAGMCTKAKAETGTEAEVKLAGPMLGAGLIIAAGLHTTAGGAATESITLAGVVATDVAVVQLHTAGAVARTVSSVNSGAGKIDVIFSGDPAADHKVNYIVIRPFA